MQFKVFSFKFFSYQKSYQIFIHKNAQASQVNVLEQVVIVIGKEIS